MVTGKIFVEEPPCPGVTPEQWAAFEARMRVKAEEEEREERKRRLHEGAKGPLIRDLDRAAVPGLRGRIPG